MAAFYLSKKIITFSYLGGGVTFNFAPILYYFCLQYFGMSYIHYKYICMHIAHTQLIDIALNMYYALSMSSLINHVAFRDIFDS